jgi:hypothetical protein
MSAEDKHSIKIEYQTSHGVILATWDTGGEIQVSFADSPEHSFQVLTKHPEWGIQLFDATPQNTHERVLIELITRFRAQILISSAIHSSQLSGGLGLLLTRGEDSPLVYEDRYVNGERL